MQFEATTPTFEDKVLQRAVAMVLEAIYEQSFLDCSYGFRPGRSAHQALRLVQSQMVKMAGRWVLEIDIRKFLDPSSYCTWVDEMARTDWVDRRSP
jgi:retron-type reverse transcriptase